MRSTHSADAIEHHERRLGLMAPVYLLREVPRRLKLRRTSVQERLDGRGGDHALTANPQSAITSSRRIVSSRSEPVDTIAAGTPLTSSSRAT